MRKFALVIKLMRLMMPSLHKRQALQWLQHPSVLANNGNGADNLNGIAVTSANTDVTPVTTGPLSIDADGI
jgi:hypothetical protein